MKRSTGSSTAGVRPNPFTGRLPSGNKSPQEGPPSVEPKLAPHEPSSSPKGSFAEEALPLVPRPIEEQLAELEAQIRLAPATLASDLRADGLRRLLHKATTAAEMRSLLNAIDAEPQLLRSHPRLLLALAEHGPVMAARDPRLLIDITELCIASASGTADAHVVWNILSDTAQALSLPALQALASCFQQHLQALPSKAIDGFVHLSCTLSARLNQEAAMNQALPEQRASQDRRSSSSSSSSSSSDSDPVAQPLELRPVEQEIAHTLAFASNLAPEQAQLKLALCFFGLLDEDRVRTPEQWQALKAHLSPAVLAAYPQLRLTLAKQLLQSAGASSELVREIATLCLDADPDTHLLLPVWNLFSISIQSGKLALPTAQSLLDSLSAAQQKQPPAAAYQFERARVSLAVQLKQQNH